MELIGIVVLVIIVIGLIIYNISIHKKVQTYNNINQKINSLNVLQDFMNTVGENNSVNEKQMVGTRFLTDVLGSYR